MLALTPFVLFPLLAPQEPVEKSTSVFGRLQSDFTLGHKGGTGEGVEFRRVRMGVKGDLSASNSYKVEVDFGSGEDSGDGDLDAIFADAYLKMEGLFPASVTIGHFKEPMGLDEMTSSRFITFMERSVTSGWAPFRNHGIMLSNSTDAMTWQLGYFYDSDPYGAGNDEDATSIAGRFVYRPSYADKGKDLVHLGLSWNTRNGSKGIKFYPGSHLTGSEALAVADPATIGIELAWTDGPLSVMAEFMSAEESASGSAATGTSVQASWFLGDQHRAYKTSSGAFDRAKGTDGGAWEVAIRHGSWDFSEFGGAADSSLAIGLNWYLDKYTRVMIDATQIEREVGGSESVAAVRFAYDF